MPDAVIYVDYENLWRELEKIASKRGVRFSHKEVIEYLLEIADRYNVPNTRLCRFTYFPLEDAIEAITAFTQGDFTTYGLQSAGPGKNVADAMIANDARTMLESNMCPDLFILATGDHFFKSLVEVIHLERKRILVVGVEGSTNRGLLNASDETPILLPQGLSWTQDRPQLDQNTLLLLIIDGTLKALADKNYSMDRYLTFTDLRNSVGQENFFADESEASSWLNIARDEGIFNVERVPHQSGTGQVAHFFLNNKHPLVRKHLSGVPLRVLRVLHEITKGQGKPYAAFSLWMAAIQGDQSFLDDPENAFTHNEDLNMWKSYLLAKSAIIEEKVQVAPSVYRQGFNVRLECPLVNEALAWTRADGIEERVRVVRERLTITSEPEEAYSESLLTLDTDHPILSAESRAVLSFNHMRQRNISWPHQFIPMTTFLNESRLSKAIGKDSLRQVIRELTRSKSDVFLVTQEPTNNPERPLSTCLWLNHDISRVAELLNLRDDFIASFASFLSNRDGVDRSVAVRWLSEIDNPLSESAEGWLAIMEQEYVITVGAEETLQLRYDDKVVQNVLANNRDR